MTTLFLSKKIGDFYNYIIKGFLKAEPLLCCFFPEEKKPTFFFRPFFS